MNFVGHIHLARIESGGSDGGNRSFLVGSALPDIAAMGRFRLTDRPVDRAVRAGVELHHRTDDLFHRHPWFRANSKAVSQRLEEAGLSRGAARACGHVGVELLLDGRLLDEQLDLGPSVQGTLSGLGAPELGLSVAVDRDRRADWAGHLDSVSRWTLPTDYRQPAAVAARLRRILAGRPRLAFPVDHVSTVCRVLAEQQPILEVEIEELIDDLSAGLAT